MTRPRGTGRRLIAVTVATMLLVGGLSFPAQASTEASVALGLASFAVFNQLFWPILAPRVVYYPPPYYYYYPSYPSAGYPPPTGAYSVPTPAPVPTAVFVTIAFCRPMHLRPVAVPPAAVVPVLSRIFS